MSSKKFTFVESATNPNLSYFAKYVHIHRLFVAAGVALIIQMLFEYSTGK